MLCESLHFVVFNRSQSKVKFLTESHPFIFEVKKRIFENGPAIFQFGLICRYALARPSVRTFSGHLGREARIFDPGWCSMSLPTFPRLYLTVMCIVLVFKVPELTN